MKRTRERRCDQLKSTQHFIPQSLQRGGLVMTTGGHPPPEYAQKSLYVQQPSLRAGVFMVHQHYGTQTVNRGAVMLHAGQTQRWYRLHQLIYADGFICIAASSALIPVICSWKFFSTDAVTASITNPLSCFPNQPGISRAIFSQPFSGVQP